MGFVKYKYKSVSKAGFKRAENEDFIGVFPVEKGILCVVCDGLGGNNAGEVAARLSVETIHKSFMLAEHTDFLEKIKLSILDANQVLLEKSVSENSLKGMATTVEAFYLTDSTAYWGHVGDSRIYNFKKNKLKQLTKDHSLVQRLIDEGYLSIKEAENHPNRNIITRALGEQSTIDMDLSKLKLSYEEHNLFLICTDGVSGVIRDTELEVILNNRDIETISENIISLVEERGAPDNFSFVLVEKNH
ncbi:MAG: Stp1/IreP family PP2C-type Ser/Thr phosphatase [Ignavibacteriales bacterium]|nr:MAG: Stp1/IreP family PP2C-type Ser/Thr phosphatase [Ignavibacteriales bacterium]